MSVDSKEPSSEEVKVEDESNAPKESGVKDASQAKSKGKKVSIKKLSPTEIIKTFEDSQINKDLPDIYVGDTVRVGVRISEGNKERVQPYEGVVIAKRHGGIHQTITVRRIFQGIGVERIFPLNLPTIKKIEINKKGKVRRSRIYYFKKLRGKKARIKEQ